MKINYRPEIDGLRAIAVSVVILYHAQITVLGLKPFRGGFIGVDIFFVISGYLITSIILKELLSCGVFSFKHFYERRIRRIIPLLLFVMIVSLPFGWVYLMPNEFIDFSKSILYSLGFSSNFYFHYSALRYGAPEGLSKPFLHTWSLSIEEQYYVLFPLFLMFAFTYSKKHLTTILAIGLFCGLLLADWGSKMYPSATFYFIHARMWELIAGSLLAVVEVDAGHRSQNKTLNQILPTVGLFLIGHSILAFDDNMFHPSLNTLLPIIGVCLIIWFSDEDELITKILSSKIFVSVGLISYSLYLWHYPVFSLARITEYFNGDIFRTIYLIILTVILSIFSYTFVEKPARNKNNKFSSVGCVLLALGTLVSGFCVFVTTRDGLPDRFFHTENYSLNEVMYREENLHFEMNYDYDNYDNNRINVLIVGNSHAENLLKILSFSNLNNEYYFNLASPKIRLTDNNFQVKYFHEYLTVGTAVIDRYYNGGRTTIGLPTSTIRAQDHDFLEHLDKQYNKSNIVILATSWDWSDLKLISDINDILNKSGKKLIVFDNSVHGKTFRGGLNRLDQFVYVNGSLPSIEQLKTIEMQMYQDFTIQKPINDELSAITSNNAIRLIQHESVLGDTILNTWPVITNDGAKIYWDHSHLTNKGAEFLSQKLSTNALFRQHLNSDF